MYFCPGDRISASDDSKINPLIPFPRIGRTDCKHLPAGLSCYWKQSYFIEQMFLSIYEQIMQFGHIRLLHYLVVIGNKNISACDGRVPNLKKTNLGVVFDWDTGVA